MTYCVPVQRCRDPNLAKVDITLTRMNNRIQVISNDYNMDSNRLNIRLKVHPNDVPGAGSGNGSGSNEDAMGSGIGG